MSKPFSYWVRLTLVATLCTLTTFTPAMAGKFIERLLHRDCPTSNNNCCEIVVPACPSIPTCEALIPTTTVHSYSSVESLPAASSCDCMASDLGSVVEPSPSHSHAHSAPADNHSSPAPTVPMTQSPVVPMPMTMPDAVVSPSDAPGISMPIDPATTAPLSTEVRPQPATPAVTEPKADKIPNVETPAPTPSAAEKDPFGADPFGAPTKPSTETPAKPSETSSDPFGAASTSEKKPEPGYGAATEPAASLPAANPPKANTTPVDDLFGEKTDATPPAPTTTAPAPSATTETNAIDSLFGEPSAPKTEATPPATNSLDGLFDTPAPASPKAPAKDELDSLFGDPSTSKSDTPAPAADAADDLFGKPVSTEDVGSSNNTVNTNEPAALEQDVVSNETVQSNEPATQDASEDKLFDKLFEPKQPTDKPYTTPAAPKNEPDELDKLFGISSFTAPSQFNGAEFKSWVDNTGTYSVKARLAVIYSDKVKLMKENGKFTTVPLSRLSDRDYEYVKWVATSLTPEKSTKFVKKESESTQTENVR